jgi:hypothetical protein
VAQDLLEPEHVAAVDEVAAGAKIEQVFVARPTGFGRADAIYFRISIEGAGAWRAAGTLSSA